MMKSNVYRLIKKLKNKKGFSSILFIILCLLLIEVFAIFQMLLYRSFTYNEVQGAMDTIGLNTLYKTLNTNLFRDEYYSIFGDEDEEEFEDESSIDANYDENATDENRFNTAKSYTMSEAVKEKLLKTYQKEMNTWLANENNGADEENAIRGMDVTSLDASIEWSSWGTGAKHEEKAQLMMDGLIEVRVDSKLNLDPLGGLTQVAIFTSHPNSTGGTYEIKNITYDGTNGQFVILVRSMVRLIIEN